ncbi:Phosphotransferase enzyme [Tulasnella sp. JGI-2019a]|nr:Phosphotransferase enzyme [Tulasnella sp. JGI-2019a]
MDFARTVLGLPVPRVIKYSSRAKSTPVGCEFILMDVVDDMEFHDLARRSDTSLNELSKTVRDTAAMLQTLCQAPFSQIGSLYYKEDVSPELQRRPLYATGAPASLGGADRFRIGPSVGSEFWSGSREHLLVDRGPWQDMVSYAIAAARCQQMWLKVYASPRVLIGPVGDTKVEETPSTHCALLDTFIHIIPYLVPEDDRLLRSILWHPDLNGSNIFVNDSTFGSRGSVIAFIDWQGSCCSPLVLQARHPLAMEYVGTIDDLPVTTGLDEFIDPETIGTGRKARKAMLHRMFEEKAKENDLYQLSTSYIYRDYLIALMHCVSGTWSDGYAWFRENLYRAEEALRQHHPNYIPLPVVPRTQLATHQAQYQATLLRHHHFELVQDSLGLVGEGWVNHEKYASVMKKLPGQRKEWNEARLGSWPFQDGTWSADD